MRSIYYSLLALFAMVCLLLPDLVLAAGGKADLLIVVADDRVVQWSFYKILCAPVQHRSVHVRSLVHDNHRSARRQLGSHY